MLQYGKLFKEGYTMKNDREKFLSWVKRKNSGQEVMKKLKIGDCLREGFDERESYAYDERTTSARICVQVQGTMYEGRSPRIEFVTKGDSLKLQRETDYTYNVGNISVQNKKGESLGNLSVELCNVLSPLLDCEEATLNDIKADYVKPLSKCSSQDKKARLYVSFNVKLKKVDYSKISGCTVCLLGGEQGSDFTRQIDALFGTSNYLNGIWVQELRVLHCKMDIEQAKLIFELYNRYHKEYDEDNNETGYFGLDNLEEEVFAARQKMRSEKIAGLDYSGPENSEDEDIELMKFIQEQIRKEPKRYGSVEAYFAKQEDDPWLLQHIFKDDSVGEEIYYWQDQTHITDSEFDVLGGFYHWYEIAELFPVGKLPVNLEDEDTVSIMGTNKFLAFADLYYGC